jgi:hypothetical protein
MTWDQGDAGFHGGRSCVPGHLPDGEVAGPVGNFSTNMLVHFQQTHMQALQTFTVVSVDIQEDFFNQDPIDPDSTINLNAA